MRQERAVAMQLATSPRPTSRYGPGPDDRPASRRRNERRTTARVARPNLPGWWIRTGAIYRTLCDQTQLPAPRAGPPSCSPAPRAARPQPREHGVTLPGSSTAWRPIPRGRRAGQAARTARLGVTGWCAAGAAVPLSQLSDRPSSIRAMRRSPSSLHQPAERRARAQGLAGSRVAELAPPLHADHRGGPVRT
jgi:hypothetical protein